MFRTTFLAVILLCSLAATGCDSNPNNGDGNDDPQTSFNVTIGGDLNTTFDGFAYFGQTNLGFVIMLTTQEATTTESEAIYLLRRAGRPATGTFSVAAFDPRAGDNLTDVDPNDFVVILAQNDRTGNLLYSDDGSITVSTSSSTRLEGTLDLMVSGFVVVGTSIAEGTATLSGSFSAASGNVLFPTEN